MRAVVIGGSGQIGGWLLRHLADRGHDAVGTYQSVPYPGLVHLDGSNPDAEAAWLRETRPDLIFYPAGFTYVDGCQRDPAKALEANVSQPVRLATVALEIGARFVYFSTDYVFDGTTGPDSEEVTPKPLNVYGVTKHEAEQLLASKLGDSALILRTSWVFGPERQGKNFAYQLVGAIREGRSLAIPTDMVSTPSYGPDVAEVAVRLAEAGVGGLIHVAGSETMPRFDFARALATGFGLDPEAIAPTTTAALGSPVARPLRGGLRIDRLATILPGHRSRDLAAGIDHFRRTVAGDTWLADPMS